MNCRTYSQSMTEFALGTLPQDESEALRAHLSSGCPRCALELAELQATLNLLPLALTPVTPPAQLKERLMGRVRAGEAVVNAGGTAHQPVPAPPSQRSAWWIGPLVGGAIAAMLLIVIGGPWLRDRERCIADLQSNLSLRQTQLADLRNTLASEEEMLHSLRSPDVKIVSLEGAAAPAARGRVFMDPAKGKWWLAAGGLKPLGANRTYEFWIIPQGQKPIAAGTFDIGPSGVGVLSGAVPANAGKVNIAAVTDEPAGGVPLPTGAIQLKGDMK